MKIHESINVQSLYLSWELTNNYIQGYIVEKDGLLYKANNDIPSNTPFSIGTTGSTWSNITNNNNKTYIAGNPIVAMG